MASDRSFLSTVSCVLLVPALLLLRVSYQIVCFASPIVHFVDSFVRFASPGAAFADSFVRNRMFCVSDCSPY